MSFNNNSVSWELQRTNRKITKIIYITLAKLLMKT